MSDQLTSWLRTVLPALWAALVAWGVTKLGLGAALAGFLNGFGEQLIVPLVLALVYAGLRKLEPHLPDWATRVLLGSAKTPSYGQAGQ